FEETSVETPTCRTNNASCLGGFPRLYQKITSLKQEKPDAVVLNAGDSYQGTYWYTLLKWKIILEFMNMLPNDAHAIGNHEFDDGPAGLAPYLSGLNASVVAANMDTSKEASLKGLYRPHIVIERKGRKIGIIGVLARDHGEFIDIIVGGHTHSLLWNGPSPSVYFDCFGDYVKWEGGPIFLNRSIPEDEEVKAKLEPYAKMVHEAESKVIGRSENTLHFEDCVFGECALGDLLVDSMSEYAKESENSSYDYLSFIQRGNIKASIPSGNITKGVLFELLPFNDRIVVFELQGKYIREALERSVISAWGMQPFKGPYVLQVSVTIGKSKEALDLEKSYHVIAPAYLADGGDGFNVSIVHDVNTSVLFYVSIHSHS
ncbi:unnamed protein product, partial [Leptidea sinapis]